MVTLLCGAGIGFGVLKDHVQHSRHRRQDWEKAATSCGLQFVAPEKPDWTPRLQARAGAVEVRIEPSGDVGDLTRIVVKAPGPQDFHLVKIVPESHFPGAGIREIETGHKAFDNAYFIQGPVHLVLALLDAETRRQMLLLGDKRLEISNGALQVEVPDGFVPFVLPRLLDLCRQFAPPIDVQRRLAQNARQALEDKVRLRNLLFLAREYPGEQGTLEALRAACSDPSTGIRLRAAKELGAEGRGVLLELAEHMVDDDVSAEAVSALDRELPFERARSILEQALRRRRLKTARACLEVVGRNGAAAVDVLATIAEQEKGELAVAAAQALGDTGSPAAEPPLILALQREQTDLLIVAANALGRLGSVAAVLPLKEVYDRSWLNRELRRATRQAIAEIQSRVEGAAPGQLSLAAAETGGLSLVQTETGQLSLAAELSPPPREAGEG